MIQKKLFYPLLIGALVLGILGFVLILPNQINNLRTSEVHPAKFGLIPSSSANFDNFATKASLSENTPVPVKPDKTQIVKIIKTGAMKYRVHNYRKSRANIEKIIKTFQAYIASENEQNIYDSIENTIRIRVPADKFDGLVESLLKESASLDYKNIQAQDVTAEFIDNEARLKARREVEQRYLAILKHANNVKDILEVERQLGEIREAIEATEGQLKYLNDQVNFSTVTLIFYQTLNRLPQSENSFLYRVGESFVKGWNSLLSLLVGLIYLWPFLIILGGGVWGYMKYFKKRNSN